MLIEVKLNSDLSCNFSKNMKNYSQGQGFNSQLTRFTFLNLKQSHLVHTFTDKKLQRIIINMIMQATIIQSSTSLIETQRSLCLELNHLLTIHALLQLTHLEKLKLMNRQVNGSNGKLWMALTQEQQRKSTMRTCQRQLREF